MTFEEFLEGLCELSPAGRGFKPHKHILLLSVLKMVRERSIQDQHVYYDVAFQQTFSRLFRQHAGERDRDRPWAPFFHLSRHGFWRLVPSPNQEKALQAAGTVGSPGDLKRLVAYAELDEAVLEFMRDSVMNQMIKERLEELLAEGAGDRAESDGVSEDLAPYSLFVHEKTAIGSIGRYVEAHKLGEILSNLDLYDHQSNRYFEADLVLVARFGVYVIELKHWSGNIEVRPNSWVQNSSFFKVDPHRGNNFKAKLLRGLYERKFPSFPSVYFESVVVFTNPEVQVSGGAIPKTESQNPTFESIDRFLQYLKNQRKLKTLELSENQCKAFASYVQKLRSPGRPKDFIFPGYEIVERLYQYDDRAEVVARRTDVRHRRLSRLRIFFLTLGDHEARERATATLNAVEKIGDHPNILKVWDIPNENNYLVEGSDWSETGTLRDLLQSLRQAKKRMAPKKAVAIATGLARGLEAAHGQYVVHRALSPENVLMVNDTPKLMNFDLSFQLEEDRVTVIPDATRLKRSPYIAPEIYVTGTVPEATADLFSLGVILYEMLVGQPPFGCSTDLERSAGYLSDDQIVRLRKRGKIPGRVIDLISSLIYLNPSDRLGSAASVLEMLEAYGEAPPKTPTEPNRVLHEGEQSGLYSVEEFVGLGAEAQIYRAAGPKGRTVALKLFNLDVPLQRVLEEQRYAATARHPSLVRVDNYNQWSDGRYYIAFDWVSERSLRSEIDGGVRPNLESFVRGAEQLLDAVESLHLSFDDDVPGPILHNDIKPENILLDQAGRFVLIDFGAASHPQVGTYEGTEGYVAPDLRLGKDRKYSVDGELFALSVSLHEWLLGARPGTPKQEEQGVSGRLVSWLLKGCSADAASRYGSTGEMRDALKGALTEPESVILPEPVTKVHVVSSIEKVKANEEGSLTSDLPGKVEPNPFVSYLNTIHSRSAANENALAEFQARNSNFGHIHVSHPLSKIIEGILTGEKRKHVVLTGHAGDGKSTIAIEIYKRLSGLEPDRPLPRFLDPRENLERISLVKDLSEWTSLESSKLLAEMLESDGPRFLLVSNTGTLLEAFKAHETRKGGDWVRIESELLGRISSQDPAEMEFHETSFVVINVAMMDNLEIAQQIFERMIAKERWIACNSASCREKCPIFRNVSLIQANLPVVRERLFFAYRRMYEYGTRLTLRQLSGHMAYMITAGLDFPDIVRMSERAKPPLLSEFMFFNRFFGDNGKTLDLPAMQLEGARAVREQGFGSQLCANWERRFWMKSRGQTFQLRASESPDDFETLREYGAGLRSDHTISGNESRDQVRRAVFFLHDFGGEDGAGFLRSFLRSSTLLDFVRWQSQDSEILSLQERSLLHKRILHVLQEHFTGVRLPEGVSTDRHLFVTLCRRSHDVRQSAQVVLGRYPEDEFQVRLRKRTTQSGEIRRELVLEGPSSRGHLDLPLSLPFLDYVMFRNRGEIGQALQASYVDRLEKFKGQLIRHASARRTDDIMLVRLRTNHTFRRQIFAVRNGRLEVTDA